MKKQFTKFKIAAGNLSWSNKPDCKDYELETVEKQVEKYRDVLDKMVRKLPAVDTQERDKRIKKNSHYKIGQALDESSRELTKDMPFHHVLANCGELEKSLAECIVDSELETETKVVRRLKQILDNEIQEIATLKRNVTRTEQEYASLKRSYEAAIRLDEPQSKIKNIKDQQEQCELKLEKERDAWAAQMFELIAKEDIFVESLRDYVLNQRNYHERALHKVNSSLASIQDTIQSTAKSRFSTSLADQLSSTQRGISYVLELCICCLVENGGLYEEGLLRVGCASTKLRRMKNALEAQQVKTPLPLDYQDPHVIGSILKLYLRELPEPLLTYKLYKDFISAAERNTETERKADIKATLAKLPKENYANLRYLTRFLWLVTQNSEQNKMNSQNVAIVMSPNVLWPRMDKSSPADYLGQVNSSSAVNVIVELLISHWDYFFEGEVDFFVTLQRHRLFVVEGKSKSNSSNENLDRHEGDNFESPRYGTLRRQKPNAPSPPAKIHEKTPNNINTSNGTSKQHYNQVTCEPQPQKNGELKFKSKELFPTAAAVATSNNGATEKEKPEKPPLPKLPPIQAPTQEQQSQQPVTPAKPTPMTRTQFFGLDTLPSPVDDRKSTDSVSSLNFKPDLPQKPKVLKRPAVLGLNAPTTNKSDEEESMTTAQTNNIDGGGGGLDSVKNRTSKFIDNMRGENCDNASAAAAAGTTVNSATHSNTAAVANATTQEPAHVTPTTPVSPNMLHTPKRPTIPAPPPPTAVAKKQVE